MKTISTFPGFQFKNTINLTSRIAVLLMIFLFSLSESSAQKHSIKATITDGASNERLAYVRVGIFTMDSAKKTIAVEFTDIAGKVTVNNIPDGTYLLNAFMMGYAMYSDTLVLTAENKSLDLGTIKLSKGSQQLGEMTVVAERPLYTIDGEKTLYNVADDPTLEGGTAADALQNAPGVEVDIEGNITLRGVSSIEIWINGKPSRMNADNLKEFIQQMPANTLDRIEVITNPSARYSAKGIGGIINVVTRSAIKKNSFYSFGLNGSTEPFIRPWFSYAFANEKMSLNVYANFNYQFRKSDNEYDNIKLNNDFDTTSVTSGFSKNRHNNFRGGLFFNGRFTIDTLNEMGFWTGFHPGYSKSTSMTEEDRIEKMEGAGLYSYLEDANSSSKNFSGFGGLWYSHNFKNDERHKIGADLGFNIWNYKNKTDFIRDYAPPKDLLDKTRNNRSDGNSFSLSGSLDYELPYHKNGLLEIGMNGSYSRDRSLAQIDTLDRYTEKFVIDSLRLNNTLQSDADFGAYITLEHKFGNFTFKAGLRAEMSYMNMQILNSPKDNVKKTYPGLFPSIHLSYHTKDMHNFKLSYTRRVSNPSASMITTFTDYDEDSFSTGNPALRPTYTNSLEAGWTKFFTKFGSVGITAYYKDNKNQVSDIVDVAYNDVFRRYVNFSQPINIGHSYNVGGDLNVTCRVKSFMNIRFYANVYYYHSKFQFRDEETPQVTKSLNYSFRLNFWAKAWKVLEINASARYNSKTKTLFTTTRPGYAIDLGLRANFLKRKISVYLDVNDIFNWNKTVISNNNPYYISNSTNTYNSRSISLGITFRFGKMELESQANQGANM